jgi:hypothetical protein
MGAALGVLEGKRKLSEIPGANFRGMVKQLVGQARAGKINLRDYAGTPLKGLPEHKR